MLVPFGTHTDTPFPMVHQCLTMFITTISEPAYISSYHAASYGIPRSGSALSAGTPSASIAKRKSSPVDSARLASKAAVAATPLLAVDSHGIATEMIILGLMSIYYLYIICYNTFLTLYRLSALPFFDIYQSGSMTPCQQISYPFGILSPESGLPSVQRNNATGWLLPLRPSWPDKCWNHIPVIFDLPCGFHVVQQWRSTKQSDYRASWC